MIVDSLLSGLRRLFSSSNSPTTSQIDSDTRKPRILVIGAAVLTFTGVAAFGFAPLAPDASLLPTEMVSQALELPALDAQREAIDEANYSFSQEQRIRRGDTVASLLNRLGVDDADAEAFIRTDANAKALYQLRPGRLIQTRTDTEGNLLWLRYLHTPVDGEVANGNGQSEALVIERNGDAFKARDEQLQNERRIQLASGTIQSSLFGATDAANIPDAVATQIAEVFSGDIDFYRDLRRGDRFRVVYEMFYQDGEPIRAGRLLAVEFVNDGKSHQALWYQGNNGEGNYYGFDGKSLRRAFLRSPIEFSRISSGFGGRMHPILNTWRQHTGVDYASPIGTPIRSTADGVVSFVGKQNGYGNVVVLKHQGVYSTLYGHMSGFAKGLRNGTRVTQGQVIGYVGMTGWATGPHLHYEFRINNEAKDPLRVVMPQALPIPGEQLANFRIHSADLNNQINLLRSIDGA